ncbi:MAG: hypothetical protein COU07_02275 [Candidatus Harrisonbacteria bacterium CG10_big_fil_rev_8_21_14_0_10_40_38]|uniref:Magnesium transporter CorA n=1 Tax=Candidatus Harrisonbacteria bacterium CG10_big_fil_rev_8_21_14_0_10_40_38 TaxID=1974583 RepID=A0A2H0UU25_9BACT|nr:MAG: hypothetical protein COU07_02275 [Candidatus Harrisonbacteria bacterium CG10_big_fil_rev_8_21_14_0_10_40_38]
MITIYQKTVSEAEIKKIETLKNGSLLIVEDPKEEEISFLEKELSLEDKNLSDALDPYEVPRIESEDNIVYLFVRVPKQEKENIRTMPALIAIGGKYIAVISKEKISAFDKLMNGKIPFATTQKTRLTITLLSEITRNYRKLLTNITKQVRSVSTKIENIDNKAILAFVAQEEILNDFLAALIPMNVSLERLLNGRMITLYDEDKELTEDLVLDINQLIALSKATLKTIVNIREAYSTIITNNLNRVIKLLTSLTVILAVPTMIASFYGMNVNLPFADKPYAFAGILAVVTGVTALLLIVFGKKKWL